MDVQETTQVLYGPNEASPLLPKRFPLPAAAQHHDRGTHRAGSPASASSFPCGLSRVWAPHPRALGILHLLRLLALPHFLSPLDPENSCKTALLAYKFNHCSAAPPLPRQSCVPPHRRPRTRTSSAQETDRRDSDRSPRRPQSLSPGLGVECHQ